MVTNSEFIILQTTTEAAQHFVIGPLTDLSSKGLEIWLV